VKHHHPFAVGVGAAIGLWAVAALAILGGQGLLRFVPLKLVIRATALIIAALAVISIIGPHEAERSEINQEDHAIGESRSEPDAARR
jgi:putative Ca2+/H+ antiporter (TMEM165/GDT1 family)